MKRSRWMAAVVVAAAVLVAGAPVTAFGATGAAFCGQVWGSNAKQGGAGGRPTPLIDARAGQHACYDRLVLTVDGPVSGYRVGYAAQVLTQGQGVPLSLRGGAFLAVTMVASTSGPSGAATFSPADPANAVAVGGFRTFRQVAFGGSFEGYTTFGLGVRALVPFRVFVLAGQGGPSRLVIDVGHQW